TEKLLTFALGRRLEYYDMPTVRAIVRRAAEDDYRFSSIVMGIANSVPFRMRAAAQDDASQGAGLSAAANAESRARCNGEFDAKALETGRSLSCRRGGRSVGVDGRGVRARRRRARRRHDGRARRARAGRRSERALVGRHDGADVGGV